jgi:murein DD-endopeptidase MepM/ murein hydrolase activator NlpD
VARLLPRGRTQTHATEQHATEAADDHLHQADDLDQQTTFVGRRRWSTAGAAGLLAFAVGLPTVGPAVSAWGDEDDLKHRRSMVNGRLRDAKGDLGHSSQALTRAVRRLDAAQARLSEAQVHLQQTRVQLEKAIALDELMQRRLDEAKARLEAAREELADGQAAVLRQRRQLAEFAAESFQSSDNRFLEMRVFLRSESPESLTTQMDAVDSISNKQSVSFAHLRASEVLLKVNEEEVQAAKREVAAKRAAAARNLDAKEALEAEAEAAEQAVSNLVDARAGARREAEAAKQADLAEVQELESERARIQDRLAEIARRRAAALARAREAAEARRAAAAAAAEEQSSCGGGGGGGGGGGSAPVDDGLIYPVDSYITSSYGMRYHPILHYTKLHDGTDFGAGCGTPVRAADSGQVLSTYYSSGYGNQVLIDHGIERGVSLSTSYNHLTSFAVSPGEHVEQGEVIAYSGTTGYSTGCHLHFMVYENGGTVDPMGWL